jgi:hypothetical protein
MKLCKDCKHYEAGFTARYDRCTRITDNGYDKVRGKVKPNHSYCTDERQYGLLQSIIISSCGKLGRYYVGK